MIKVAIIEDKRLIRTSIIEKTDWTKLGAVLAGEASNGREGLEVIRKVKPDIVITDMKMPVMDGAELLSLLREEYPDIKVVVISAFSDFEFTRQALLSKAVDYILKPIDREELNNVLQKAVNEIHTLAEENNRLDLSKLELSKNILIIKETLLNNLISANNQDFEALALKFNNVGINISYRFCGVIVLEFLNYNYLLKEIYQNDINLFNNTTTDILEKINSNLNIVAFNLTSERRKFVLLYRANDCNILMSSGNLLESTCSISLTRLEEINGSKAYIGIGSLYDFPGRVQLSFKEAITALNSININSSVRLLHFNNISHNPIQFHLEEEKISLLVRLLNSGNREQALLQADSILEIIKSAEYLTKAELNSIYTKILFNLDINLKSSGMGLELTEGIHTNTYSLNDINFNSIYEFENWLKSLLNDVTDNIKKLDRCKTEDVIKSIKEYLNMHFCEKILLKEIADNYYISQEHLCRLFKKAMGLGFHEYLTSIRMKKAEELLKKHKMKIEAVAEMVGYDNVHHFSNVFRKYFSESPSSAKMKD